MVSSVYKIRCSAQISADSLEWAEPYLHRIIVVRLNVVSLAGSVGMRDTLRCCHRVPRRSQVGSYWWVCEVKGWKEKLVAACVQCRKVNLSTTNLLYISLHKISTKNDSCCRVRCVTEASLNIHNVFTELQNCNKAVNVLDVWFNPHYLVSE